MLTALALVLALAALVYMTRPIPQPDDHPGVPVTTIGAAWMRRHAPLYPARIWTRGDVLPDGRIFVGVSRAGVFWAAPARPGAFAVQCERFDATAAGVRAAFPVVTAEQVERETGRKLRLQPRPVPAPPAPVPDPTWAALAIAASAPALAHVLRQHPGDLAAFAALR